VTERDVKVSVLIPTFNYARYLPQAIESVLAQSCGDFELLISDDASSDESAEIIRSYASHDERIRFHIQSGGLGMVSNWNWCLREARGRYIKYLFADDYLLRNDSLATLLQLIEARPDIALASSAREVVDQSSNPIDRWENIGSSGIFEGIEAISWSLRSNCNVFGEPSAVLFKRGLVAEGFDPSYVQVVDWELWIRLLQQGHLAYTTDSLTAFRRHPHQQTERNRVAMGGASEHTRLMKQYSNYLVFNSKYQLETFDRLYRLRRKDHLEPHEMELAEWFAHALGSSYFGCLVRYKMSRPFFRMRRFWIEQVKGQALTRVTHPQAITPMSVE